MRIVHLVVESIGWITVVGIAAIPVLWVLSMCGVIRPLGQR